MILEVKDVYKYFTVERGPLKQKAGQVKALEGVSFCLDEFGVLGVAGESGSGKTTLAKIILKLIPVTAGEIVFNPQLIKKFRKDVQVVFQNPYASLDPKMRIIDMITEPLRVHRIVDRQSLRRRVRELLQLVGLDEQALDRYPMEFSGGQRQRICIARALASEPKLIVLDEPISSLDLTVQAKMLDLFLELKKRLGLTYIFISHNLAVIRHLADKIIVMQNGRIVEEGSASEIFRHPRQEYTRLLIAAAKS
jgi:ABC-type glutathione transport system ATPase component